MNEADQKLTTHTMKLVNDLLAQMEIIPRNDYKNILHFNLGKDKFEIQFNCMSATFWDVAWGWIDTNQRESESLKTAVNFSNLKSSATVIYTEPDENGIVFIHTKRTVVFVPNWEGNANLLNDVFESFNKSREEMVHLYFSKKG